MSDSDLKITITTVADVAGSDATASSLDRIQAAAKRAGDDVDKAMRAADAAKPLTELQKLEFELQKVTAEAKVMDAALAKIQSAGGSAPGLARQIEQKDTQQEMLAGQIAALSALESKGKGAAGAMVGLEGAQKALGRTTGQTAEAIGYMARDLNDMFLRGGRGAIGNTMRMTTALGGTAGLGAAIGGVAMGLALLWPELKKLWEADPKVLEDSAKFLDEMGKKASALGIELANKNFSDWVKTVDAGRDALEREGKQLERNVAMMRERRAMQWEEEDAQAGLALLKIDNDPKLTAEDKIRERMKLREEVEQRKVKRSITKADDEVVDAEQKDNIAYEKAAEARSASDVANKKAKSEVEKLRLMEAAKIDSENAKNYGVPEAQKALNTARSVVVMEFQKDRKNWTEEDIDKRVGPEQKALEEAQHLADWSQLKQSKLEAQAANAKNAKKEAEKKAAEVTKREEDLDAADIEKENSYAMSEERKASILRRAETEKQARSIAYQAVEQKSFRERPEQASDTTAKAEQKADAELKRRETLSLTGTQAAKEGRSLNAPGLGTDRLADAAEKLRKHPNQDNETAVLTLLHQLLAWAERSGKSGDSKLASLQARMAILEGREKTTRDQ